MAFAAIGLMIFALEWLLAREPAPDENQLIVSTGQVEHIVSVFLKTNQRLPSNEELNGLIDAHITEEVLYREAVRIGLDQDDTIVRRRMRQKMEFLLDDLSTREPTDEELEAFLAAAPGRFETPALYSFEQVYFSSDADLDAQEVLAQLADGTPAVDIASTRGLLPDRINEKSVNQVASQYGREFAEWMSSQTPGAWQGPVESPFGTHFVRVNHVISSEVPPLGEIRNEVRREWLDDQRTINRNSLFDELRNRYEIIVEYDDDSQP